MVKKIIIAYLLLTSCHHGETYPPGGWDQRTMMDSILVIDSILRSDPCKVVIVTDTPELDKLNFEALEAEDRKCYDRHQLILREMDKHVNDH